MKIKLAAFAICSVALASPAAFADRDIQTWSIQEAMSSENFQDRLGNFRFVWGDTVSGQRVMSTSTRKATNGINKSDRAACEWALLSALIAFKEQAEANGATSVQGIKSTATGTPFSSTTEFQCITGWTNSRVYLEAEIVK
ncbi:MAG: excinuclease ATPase [Hyphomonadaceae bacterium]|nr:excinuclease ATPase [Hyphomonadaceae bacterium]